MISRFTNILPTWSRYEHDLLDTNVSSTAQIAYHMLRTIYTLFTHLSVYLIKTSQPNKFS